MLVLIELIEVGNLLERLAHPLTRVVLTPLCRLNQHAPTSHKVVSQEVSASCSTVQNREQ